jgi:UDP-2,4-diacetamido-2,4,6-trideoxy-beta-L-altropyranose hydrolase
MTTIIFRCDASLLIGSGHVMRCRTLAFGFKRLGIDVIFVCRKQLGHLISILEQDFSVLSLPELDLADCENMKGRELHGAWLGCGQEIDAVQSLEALAEAQICNVNLIIVDHYGLDYKWESLVLDGFQKKGYSPKLMVLDDLADRAHLANMLLDQNYYGGEAHFRYQKLVDSHCLQLLGPNFALVRPEFQLLRHLSLSRREEIYQPKRILVFLGGSDPHNETSKVIEGLMYSKINWEHVDIVVGQHHPGISELNHLISLFQSALLHVQTSNMAKLMACADIAITGGGTVTWEKCTLGLPSLVALLGENQKEIADSMHASGAQITLGFAEELAPSDYAYFLDKICCTQLKKLSSCASKVCDGTGLSSVLNAIGAHTK